MKLFGSLLMLTLGMALSASAAVVPEIDAGSSVQAFALLSGAALVVRSWRRK